MTMNEEMSKDINDFLNDSEVESKIISMLNKTKNNNNEYGFLFAITENEVLLI